MNFIFLLIGLLLVIVLFQIFRSSEILGIATKKISKSLMTPNLGKKSNKRNQKTINKTLINKISKYKKIVEENFEYVGDKFTEEAKKMKYGEVDERAIYGEADLKQAKELVDEDIDFQPLPWPSDKKTN